MPGVGGEAVEGGTEELREYQILTLGLTLTR